MSKSRSEQIWQLDIGGLTVLLDSGEEGFPVNFPACHTKFLRQFDASGVKNLPGASVLSLRIHKHAFIIKPSAHSCLCHTGIWELWSDTQQHLIFTQPKQSPQRWVVIQPGFRDGEVYVDLQAAGGEGCYPLQFIDIVIFSNWLALSGDLILHASGIAYHDKGYCFLGNSGAGKSTLAGDLAVQPGVTILGEDQVILRYQAGRFFLYGTPWHERTDRCAALCVPLEKMFFLDRTHPQVLSGVEPHELVLRIMRTAFVPYYRRELLAGIMTRLESLSGQVPMFDLAYSRGSDILATILQA